jgi:hypothetical protein
MIKNINDKSISKRQAIENIKEWLKKEKELALRKVLSEESFEATDWSKYLAYQLGFIKALEKLDNFIPDPENINV